MCLSLLGALPTAAERVVELRVVSAGLPAGFPAGPGAGGASIRELVSIARDPRCEDGGAAAAFFAGAIDQGLSRLAAWDPEVAAGIRRSARGGMITLGCRGEERADAGGFHVRSGGWLGRRRSRVVVSGLDESAAAPATRSAEAVRRQAFHEFLHFAGLETAPRHGEDLPVAARQADRVFSCDGMAYPEHGYVARAPDGRGLPVTRRSCETCLGGPSPRCGGLPDVAAPL